MRDAHYHVRDMHNKCRQYKSYHVQLTTTNGETFDGIIENVGMDNMTMLVGEDVMEQDMEMDPGARQFYGYGRPRRRFRRFRRRTFPIATLATLALFPYIFSPVYPYPYFF